MRHTALEWFKKFDAVSHGAQFSGPGSSMYTVCLSGKYLQSKMSAITFTLTTLNCMLSAHRTIIRTRRDKLQNV